MNNKFIKYLICFLIIAFVCLSGIIKGAVATADDSKIKLTTCDLHKPYIIKGLIQVRTGQPDVAKINEMLVEEAKKIDADCVVGVGYMEAYGYLFGYGTAVKVK